MKNLARATRITGALLAAAAANTAVVELQPEGPMSEGIRDAIAHGFLSSMGAGVRLTEVGERILTEKDPRGSVELLLDIETYFELNPSKRNAFIFC